VRLKRASVRQAAATGPITVRTPLTIEFDYWNLQPDARLHVTLHLIDAQGAVVFSSASFVDAAWQGRPYPVGLYRSECEVPADLLNDGHYSLKLFFVMDGGHVLAVVDDLLNFTVQDDPTLRGDWYGSWPGAVRPLLDWKTARLEPEIPSPEVFSPVSPSPVPPSPGP
jgi:lipopolysaccharide transport system ATP-binding protein